MIKITNIYNSLYILPVLLIISANIFAPEGITYKKTWLHLANNTDGKINVDIISADRIGAELTEKVSVNPYDVRFIPIENRPIRKLIFTGATGTIKNYTQSATTDRDKRTRAFEINPKLVDNGKYKTGPFGVKIKLFDTINGQFDATEKSAKDAEKIAIR